MKGIIKLKVPTVQKQIKLFVIVLSREGKQHKFSKVAYSLDEAISKCWLFPGGGFTIHNYTAHSELTVDEINNLFKNYNP